MAARRPAGFAAASPKQAGLDPDVLAEFRKALRQETKELKSLAGAAHIVLHRGRCVFSCADGVANEAAGTRFTVNTPCRLHGATKPLLAAALLMLADSGKCKLSDPVAKYIRFPDLVAVSSKAKSSKGRTAKRVSKKSSKSATRACNRPATLKDLLLNTAGLANYDKPREVTGVMRRVKRGDISNLKQLCESVAEKPLKAQPGTRYDYSFAYEIVGRVCEVISGKPLERFMEEDFLKRLGMNDTHFKLPSRKRSRAAELYEAKKVRCVGGHGYQLTPYAHADSAPGILSGGGGILSYNDAGMWSTASDYARFCQMLLAGGVAQRGVRVLKTSTARALWRDALAPLGGRDGRLSGWHDQDGTRKGGWWDHRGLSLLHTFLDFNQPPESRRPRRSRSMWWSGGGGAFWTIDAARQMVTVSFSQTFGGREDEEDGHGPLAYRISPYVE